MRIQAHALREAGAYQQAISLLDRTLEDHPDHLDTWLYEDRAMCHQQLGNFEEATQDYLKSVESMRRSPGVQSSAPLLLARLVCEQGDTDHYEECLGLLVEFWDPNPLFPRNELHQFGWTAILLELLGKHEDAKPPARRALAAAAKTQSNAAKHRTLGLVDDSDRPMLKRLQKIVGGRPFVASGIDARALMAKLRSLASRLSSLRRAMSAFHPLRTFRGWNTLRA